MKLTQKYLDEFTELCRKKGIEYKTESEAKEAAQNLLNFVELMADMAYEELQRKKKLEKSPQGFSMKGEGRTCFLCSRCVIEDIWYDKWGFKCMDCYQAFKKKIIPGYVFKDRDNKRHVTASTLSWKYNLHPQTIKKLIRIGELKPCIVNSEKYPDTIVFLKTENPNIAETISKYSKDRET